MKYPKSNHMTRISILAIAAALTACGGGGGEAESDNKTTATGTAPTVTEAPKDPGNLATSVPMPTYPVGSDERKIFDELNFVRLNGNFGMVAQDINIDKAATSHAKYLTQNYFTRVNGSYDKLANINETDPSTGWLNGHVENANWPGFSGILPNDRIKSFGGNYVYGGEVVSYYLLNKCLDLLLNTVFHRSALLNTDLQFFGIGFDKTNEYPGNDFGSACVIKTAIKSKTNKTNTDWIGIYPANTQKNVSLGMGGEAPDPAPEIPNIEKGSPVTIYTDKNISTISSFTLTAKGSAVSTPVKIIVKKDFPGYMTEKEAHILPKQLLLKNTTYEVKFRGTLIDGTPVNKDWTFSTIL